MLRRHGASFPARHRGCTKKWEQISNNSDSPNWLVGNSQMAKFHAKCGTYQIAYKRGAKLMEIIKEAEWIISNKKATHVILDGIQNSVPEIIRGNLKLEDQVLEKLRVLNKSAVVVLAEVLYCPEHQRLNDALNLVNRQVRRLNRAASGQASPQPWKVLVSVKRDKGRKRKDQVSILPGAYSRDGYHISHFKAQEYEAKLATYLKDLVMTTPTTSSTSTPTSSVRN